ncbi:putative ABC transport system ATP-binding protein [Rhodopseudomonas julia]|uniref:ABC transport system ATP-binding protein n=1 Tax=Rhodopseudomonas julia TaxID=200617 RepID=A0ABU0C7F8_9BRAD|nr:ABC transporter ATP-binding protein [Rhodopseudomonas julia]MDQ0326460.1 putative ABC transport system ATP-binding protein [Rhodopseudomonas julia]
MLQASSDELEEFEANSESHARPVIETRGLTKRFGTVTALDHIDLTIRAGEFVSVMGPSGSGKTTFLNLISCLDTPTEGSYLLDGIDVSTFTEKERAVMRRERIGLVFQQFHLIPYLNAQENVMLAQHYHSVVDAEGATRALERVGLADRAHHLPSQLSGGEQQRVCIARALINEPSLILADEPTGNLDAKNEHLVMELFSELHREGRVIVLITHNPELGRLTDRTIWFEHGRRVRRASEVA